jgi:hypothetical protein
MWLFLSFNIKPLVGQERGSRLRLDLLLSREGELRKVMNNFRQLRQKEIHGIPTESVTISRRALKPNLIRINSVLSYSN